MDKYIEFLNKMLENKIISKEIFQKSIEKYKEETK